MRCNLLPYKTIFLLILSSQMFALKIDRAIVSTNNNPTYIQFWPVIAHAWKQMGIQPTLALIAEADVQIDESIGDVIRFEPIPGVSEALQAQTIRLLLPCYFPDDCCLVSDIDMVPLNQAYFSDPIQNLPEDAFVIYRDRVYGIKDPRYPMCYVVAKGSVFKSVFKISALEEIPNTIRQWSQKQLGWDTDECILYRYVANWESAPQNNCVKLGHSVERRLDRADWRFDPQLVADGYYVDAHCPRPYSDYKESIDLIIQLSGNQP